MIASSHERAGSPLSLPRRQFIGGVAAVLAGGSVQSACSAGGDPTPYERLAADIRRPSAAPAPVGRAAQRELVRFATLAANSHNSQPWKFVLGEQRIDIVADTARRCPAVDPDDHHLYASLGCAAENLVVAAPAFGLEASVSLAGIGNGVVRIDLQPTPPRSSPLFAAIPRRQSTRAEYSGKPAAPDAMAAVEAAAERSGVTVRTFTATSDLEAILEYVVAGNSAQMRDAAFVKELKHWIRFNESVALRHRDGLFSASSGNPVVPDWFGRSAFRFVFTERGENDRYRAQIRSSSGVVTLSSDRDDRASWVNVGRSAERLCLQATAMGLKQAYINQPVEVPEIREQFARYLGLSSGRPDLLIRFGYGPELPKSLRRPLEAVIEDEDE